MDGFARTQEGDLIKLDGCCRVCESMGNCLVAVGLSRDHDDIREALKRHYMVELVELVTMNHFELQVFYCTHYKMNIGGDIIGFFSGQLA